MFRLARHVFLASLLTLIALGFCWRGSLMANWPNVPPLSPSELKYGYPLRTNELATLDTKLPPDVHAGPTLHEACEAIQAASSIPISVEWDSLRLAGVGRNCEVMVDVGGMRLEDAIDCVLLAAGHGKVFMRLFFSGNGGISIYANRNADGLLLTCRPHDVTRLLAPDGAPTHAARIKELETTLTQRVAPGTWIGHGGRVGKIREGSPGCFYVIHTPQTHHDLKHAIAVMTWRADVRAQARRAVPYVMTIATLTGLVHVVVDRRSDRKRAGHCRKCGYDLRATPGRCPECGEIPAEASTSDAKLLDQPSVRP